MLDLKTYSTSKYFDKVFRSFATLSLTFYTVSFSISRLSTLSNIFMSLSYPSLFYPISFSISLFRFSPLLLSLIPSLSPLLPLSSSYNYYLFLIPFPSLFLFPYSLCLLPSPSFFLFLYSLCLLPSPALFFL